MPGTGTNYRATGICPFDKNRATGKQAFVRLINVGQRAERALAILQTGGQKRALGMPVGNTTLGYISSYNYNRG